MIKISRKKLIILIMLTVLGTAVVSLAGVFLYNISTNQAVISRTEYRELKEIGDKYRKLYFIQGKINRDYLWETDENAQMDAVYKALFQSLGDEYSSYMNKDEYSQWIDYITGTFTGVGITFTTNDDGQYEIVSVMKGGPAASAEMAAGDIICEVDGKTYGSSEEVSKALRGREGTTVSVTYIHDGEKKEISLVRALVEEATVFSKVLDDKCGYVRIASFEKNTAEQFETELASFETKGITGVVIDLRDNPGGLVESGIKVADLLLPECTITHTEDKRGKKKFYNSDERCTKLKYVLLVNENTASASEIISAAVKDNKGGKIVGTKTFGKGVIQSTMELNDHSAIKLTTMQYFSPSNRKIHKIGVTPDVTVGLPKDGVRDTQLEKALEILKNH